MPDAVDIRSLHYFAVVAEESNLRRAADRLFMAQPPLSCQIKQLEERLGVALFTRHSKGLTLTDNGAKVLEIIQPLLQMEKTTFARLREEIHRNVPSLRIGFTTAFEQGVFSKLEASLGKTNSMRLLLHCLWTRRKWPFWNWRMLNRWLLRFQNNGWKLKK